MPETRVDGPDGLPGESLASDANRSGAAEPEGEVAEALSRVQRAVIGVKEGDLRESVETAIEVINSNLGTAVAEDKPQLCNVADALEQALDELEKGKVANLLPVIKQAKSIVQSGTAED